MPPPPRHRVHIPPSGKRTSGTWGFRPEVSHFLIGTRVEGVGGFGEEGGGDEGGGACARLKGESTEGKAIEMYAYCAMDLSWKIPCEKHVVQRRVTKGMSERVSSLVRLFSGDSSNQTLET